MFKLTVTGDDAMLEQVLELLEQEPVIAAVKDDEGLRGCLAHGGHVTFVLYGSVTTAAQIVRTLKESGRTVFLDVDLVVGLSAREAAVDFVAQEVRPDGVISTKAALVRRAKAKGLLTVYRTFMIDSMALSALLRADALASADFVETLPGTMPKIIRTVRQRTHRPLIASGLITDKEDVISALSAGACAVSTTNPDVWRL